MTCVLDHDGNPFFAGTYFPDQPRHGQPSFRQVLEALTDAWQTKPRGRAARGRQRCASTWAGRRRWPAGAISRARRSSQAVRAAGAGVRRGARRLRRRAEVPAVDGAGVPAPARRAGRCSPRTLRGDGARRPLRPARRRLRALLRRRGLGGAALREDALRQRPAARPLRAGGRAARGEPGRPRDRRLHAPRAAHRRGRVRVRAGRRQRGRRGQVLRLDAGPAGRGARGGRRRVGGAGLRGHRRPAPSSTAPRRCSCSQDPEGPGEARLADVRRRLLDGSRRAGPPGPATTRWSPPGTGWRSAASATPGCGSASRRTSTRRSPPASCCGGCTWSTVGCGGSRATASSARRPGCWRTTAAWRPASSRSCRRPATRSGSTARGACWTPRSSGSAPTTAASSTPPTTPRRWSPGRATRATTRRPSGLSSMVHALVDAHALTGAGRYRHGRRGGAGHGRDPRRAGAAVRRLVARRRPDDGDGGPLEVAVVGPAGDRARTRSRCGPASTPARWWSRRTARATTYRSCPGVRRSTAAPAAYVCRGFVCERPVTTPLDGAWSSRVRAQAARTGAARVGSGACRATPTTTSSSAPGAPEPCSPRGCRRTPAPRCSCSRPAARPTPTR